MKNGSSLSYGVYFRDQKEAPKAMMWYNKAIECADTLSKNVTMLLCLAYMGKWQKFTAVNIFIEKR